MSERYRYAIKAINTHDLLDLAQLLSGSVREAIQEGQMPHMDPAVRLICHHVAFAGNGDLAFRDYYTKIYDFCVSKAKDGPNVVYSKENESGTTPH